MSRTSKTPPASTGVETVALRIRKSVPLRDIDIARENLRFNEAADDDVPVLAATLLAAGQLQPITVRPGKGKAEKPSMALDGRRRLLAFRLLLAEGVIGEDHPIDVFEEVDPARQAAAVLLTNTAVPVHVADVIASIGRMLKAKLTVSGIARALGYEELEIKRLAALAGLPPEALQALKAGQISLRQARLLARLPDKAEQAEMARLALDGHGFQDWRIREQLDASRVTSRDRRFGLVGADRYTAAGGRIETDLFDELPPVLLDPEILTELWLKRAHEIAAPFEAKGVAVHVTAGQEPEMPEDLEALGYSYGRGLTGGDLEAWKAAKEASIAAADHVCDAVDLTADEAYEPLVAMVRTRIAKDQAGVGGRVVTAMVMWPSAGTGLDVRCYSPVEILEPEDDEVVEPRTPPPPAYQAPEAEAPEPEIEGVGHALHAVRTDVATRGLIRALADAPGVALTALLSRLFSVLVIRSTIQRSDAALALIATPYGPTGTRSIEALDGEVRQRLDGRRAVWEASGATVVAWIDGLSHDEKMSLLAELTALSLDLREERTTLIRRHARAEAAELSALCQADITMHWSADADFLRSHSKAQLLEMLSEMGVDDVRASALKKTELIDWVAEQAADRRWAPASLEWAFVLEDEPADADSLVAPEGDDPNLSDGAPPEPALDQAA